MTELDHRTRIHLDVVLEEVCRSLPHGGDHELRKKIAKKLLASALEGDVTLAALSAVARGALAEATTKESA
jgi:hypothetical protein